ncbi:transcription termination/antitermination protein NusG [candidate division CSSED10-310 bacterium]|uniref:Transcription termination/antitermination protein NusG n=1 Tax=candidate division CSSED10-310 bacterium TaxID=2855610 RepID=A0ABV6YXR1_UNCC1
MTKTFIKTPGVDHNPPHNNDLYFYSDEPLWYALYTRSRAEKKVYQLLNNKIENQVLQEMHLFLPLQRVMSRWADRLKEVDKPLFPGYVFAQTRLSNYMWRELVITPGVANLLHRNAEPLAIPQKDIDAIQQILASKIPFSPYILFKEGQKVIAKRGPLQGIEGVLQKINPKTSKLVVNFPILNRSVRTLIDVWDVEPI